MKRAFLIIVTIVAIGGCASLPVSQKIQGDNNSLALRQQLAEIKAEIVAVKNTDLTRQTGWINIAGSSGLGVGVVIVGYALARFGRYLLPAVWCGLRRLVT